jgi:hypothetical protein
MVCLKIMRIDGSERESHMCTVEPQLKMRIDVAARGIKRAR